ncbi:MAG: flagellin [Rhizobiaceae bacterium]|jgi:flagellin|nr:flagellin [Rhizobiaceae bacterium]
MNNSINTNTNAMTALQSLNQTNKMLSETQNAIATGFKVASASDNAAYWSIATTMRSDNKALGTVQDALGLGSAKVDIASSGLESSIEVVSEIKAKLVAAREPGVDKTKVQSEIDELKNQLSSIAESSSFNGVNWLQNDTAASAGTAQIVGSFSRAANGTVGVSTIDIDVSSFTLIGTDDENLGLLTNTVNVSTGQNFRLIDVTGETTSATGTVIAVDGTTTDAALDNMIQAVDTIIDSMTDAAADLGSAKSRVDLQKDFVSKLMDSIDSGISALVDADLSEESTKLQALQAQQQLGIQALSIANSNGQNLLSLFR